MLKYVLVLAAILGAMVVARAQLTTLGGGNVGGGTAGSAFILFNTGNDTKLLANTGNRFLIQ